MRRLFCLTALILLGAGWPAAAENTLEERVSAAVVAAVRQKMGADAEVIVETLEIFTAGDVSASRSLDLTSLTLTFAPGAFGRGDFLTFANFAFPVELPVQFEVDADRVQGGQVVVTLSDNSTTTGTFLVDRAERVNNFTGAGLVNADEATRRSHHRH